jgi:hypothetical protein
MLRDFFIGTPALKEILSDFEGLSFKDIDYVAIKMAKMLSPDSFIWKLEIDRSKYYLYAEDYVDSLQHVLDEIEEVAGKGAGELIRIKNKLKSMTDSDLNDYAAQSGYDNVFLYKVNTASSRTGRGTVNG